MQRFRDFRVPRCKRSRVVALLVAGVLTRQIVWFCVFCIAPSAWEAVFSGTSGKAATASTATAATVTSTTETAATKTATVVATGAVQINFQASAGFVSCRSSQSKAPLRAPALRSQRNMETERDSNSEFSNSSVGDVRESVESAEGGKMKPKPPIDNREISFLDQIFALYGGPRRFLLVNIPAAFLALGADFGGSMRSLLSISLFQPLVYSYRLDSIYAVNGLKRHYIDDPISTTFTYPGDWVYDPSLENVRLQRKDYTLQKKSGRPSLGTSDITAVSLGLPLVALGPPAGESSSLSLALYARPTAGTATTLAEIVGSPAEAQETLIMRRSWPRLKGLEPKADSTSAVELPSDNSNDRKSYFLETRISYGSADTNDGAITVWTTMQLVPSKAAGQRQSSYLLVLSGVAPEAASLDARRRVETAVRSLGPLEKLKPE